eukprot:GEMP01052712.1.p1 GENE.GEMP01052712.1~~GEMP01052712.1.p1  ORF type:complete len:391 (+),score=71.41 GEMP01052712.1:218-1390(+)
MDLVGIYAQTGAQWNPSQALLCGLCENRALVRDRTGTLLHVFACVDAIDSFSWSPDGNYILCEVRASGVVQIFHLNSKKTARIDEGLAGLGQALWAPNGKILTIADFGVRACVWDLETQQPTVLQGPKHSNIGVGFSPDSKWLAYIYRKNTDHVAVFSADAWELMSDFAVAVSDAVSLHWVADASSLLIVESIVTCRCVIYSIIGERLALYEPYAVSRNPCFALGIKSVELGDEMIALALHDNTIHLYSPKALKLIGTLEARWDDKEARYYQETLANAAARPIQTHLYDLGVPITNLQDGDVHLQLMHGAKHPPKMLKKGFTFVCFDHKKRYLAARCDGAPGNVCVFIWDTFRLALEAVIVCRSPIKHMTLYCLYNERYVKNKRHESLLY